MLRRGQKVHGPVRVLESVIQIAHIGGHPHDFEIAGVAHFVLAETLADRILALQKLLGERLVHNRHPRRIVGIALVDGSPHRDAVVQSGEEAGRHACKRSSIVFAGMRFGLALNANAVVPAIAAHGGIGGAGHSLHAGDLLNTIEHAAIEQLQLLRLVTRLMDIDRRHVAAFDSRSRSSDS